MKAQLLTIACWLLALTLQAQSIGLDFNDNAGTLDKMILQQGNVSISSPADGSAFSAVNIQQGSVIFQLSNEGELLKILDFGNAARASDFLNAINCNLPPHSKKQDGIEIRLSNLGDLDYWDHTNMYGEPLVKHGKLKQAGGRQLDYHLHTNMYGDGMVKHGKISKFGDISIDYWDHKDMYGKPREKDGKVKQIGVLRSTSGRILICTESRKSGMQRSNK